MLGVGRADECVGRERERVFELLYFPGIVIHILLHSLPRFFRSLEDLLPMLIRTGTKKHFFSTEPPTARKGVSLQYLNRKSNMGIRIHIRKCRGYVPCHRLIKIALYHTLLLLHISNKLHERSCHRHRDQYPEEPGDLTANKECDDNEYGRYADDLFDHQRIDEVIFKLLNEHIRPRHENTQSGASLHEPQEHRRHRGNDGTKDRDDLQHRDEDSEEERILHADDREKEKDQLSHDGP